MICKGVFTFLKSIEQRLVKRREGNLRIYRLVYTYNIHMYRAMCLVPLLLMNQRRHTMAAYRPWCVEYRKVDTVLRSVDEEERNGFTGGNFLKKLIGYETCIAITQTI